MTSADFFRKINMVDIFSQHLDTLRDVSARSRSASDVVLFYVSPLVPLVGLVFYEVKFADATITALATSLSIMAGLLFNLLVLLHSLGWPKFEDPIGANVAQLRRELHANICYAIVIALVAMVPIVIGSYYGYQDWRRTISGDVTAYLAIHFVLTMGLILKRIEALLTHRLD